MLERIHSPEDLKQMDIVQLETLAEEIRNLLIKTISCNGGHLASNLGAVELTLALHHVFSCPEDQFVWDVGHQSYTHKLLTGRRELFSTIRRSDGISGYPKRQESRFDAFVAGHASTSISVAEGVARAKALKGESGWAVAVVGDGAFTGGMIYEALNNLRTGDRLLIVLNDNGMSISQNVGALAEYISDLRVKPEYFQAKDRVRALLERLPLAGKPVQRLMSSVKRVARQYLYHSNLFEYFGLSYLGPVNGHNLRQLMDVLSRAKETTGPVFVHVRTVKGKGYAYAENSPQAFHGVSGFDIATGNPEVAPYDSFSTVFGKELARLAETDRSICAVTAAMETGTGLQYFSSQFRGEGRFFDVGIAEPHAVTFAAGLAANGMRPVFAVYSTFLQRAIDQVIHDCAIEKQHVVFAIDRAGVVGDDGETHQGVFDVSLLTPIPGMVIYSPGNFSELRECLYRALYQQQGPVALRYPRGTQPNLREPQYRENGYTCTVFGKRAQPDAVLVTYGRVGENCEKACEALSQEGYTLHLVRLICIHPLEDLLLERLEGARRILFVEEGMRTGGIGQQLHCALRDRAWNGRLDILAVGDMFIPQNTIPGALAQLGMDADGIAAQLRRMMG